jgi:hypothetical protein
MRRRAQLPIRRQQFVDVASRVLGDSGQDVGEPGLRIDAVHFGGDDQAVHRRGTLPTSEPANTHDVLPSAIPRSARSAALFDRQIRRSARKRIRPASA